MNLGCEPPGAELKLESFCAKPIEFIPIPDLDEYQRKLSIAKNAYKILADTIRELEVDGITYCHWDGCISVNDEFFTERQLRAQSKEF